MRFTAVLLQINKVARTSTFSAQALDNMIEKYATFHPTTLTLKNFVEFGTKKASAGKSYQFLRKEIPVRLANIMKEINLLPDQLLNMPSVRLVESWYLQSFHDILEFDKEKGSNTELLDSFHATLDRIRKRHTTVVETMAQGVLEMKEASEDENMNLENRTQYFLDRFYMSRISIRMLIHQHLLLFADMESPKKHVGCIDPSCDVLAVAEDAYENARFLCEQYYMASPDCDFHCHNPFSDEAKITMTYVPSHLYHMLFELFKNSLCAVVEFHKEDSELPHLNMLICKGKEDLTIKLCDQGGGIRRSEVDLLFNYMYSTAPRPPMGESGGSATTPLAGYGYGLPLSRLYAKYFNGDLWLSSVDGYGTDATIFLKVFASEASELLPVYNKTSSLKYAQSIPVSDWSDATHTTGLHGTTHQATSNANGNHGHNRSYSTRPILTAQPRN